MSAAALNKDVLSRLRDRARADTEIGLQHGGVEGCTFAVAHQGEILWEEGFGAAKADTPILLFSITKTVVEGALWALFGEGLSPDTPVVEIIPEFMGSTQPDITIAMIETHLAAFAWHPMETAEMASRASRVAAFSRWRLERAPGFYEYNPMNGGWVLAEIIERVSGRDYRAFLKDRVLQPLGLGDVGSVSLGEPIAEQERVLLHRNYMGGFTPLPDRQVPLAHGLDTPAGLALGMPGAGGVGTAAGVARLYQSYLTNAQSVWQPDILREARDTIRVQAPDAAGRPMLRSLSFVHAGDSDERYGERTFFGPNVSPRAFGHQGQGGQIAWADPESGLSFVYLTNTVVFPPGGCFHPRARALSSVAANLLT